MLARHWGQYHLHCRSYVPEIVSILGFHGVFQRICSLQQQEVASGALKVKPRLRLQKLRSYLKPTFRLSVENLFFSQLKCQAHDVLNCESIHSGLHCMKMSSDSFCCRIRKYSQYFFLETITRYLNQRNMRNFAEMMTTKLFVKDKHNTIIPLL